EKFRLIHVDTPLETCIKQDRTGLYQKNADGLAHNIPGVDFNYDIPENPDLRLNPNGRKISEMVDLVLAI
ncbi:MAG TPA: adenylyl-sulfate kinase, partial [Candidatus Marinimicrobia bacterium]|nr:adenylyl-sulfate kinase [Candidatus Neomarinimicrobiota bacterium]